MTCTEHVEHSEKKGTKNSVPAVLLLQIAPFLEGFIPFVWKQHPSASGVPKQYPLGCQITDSQIALLGVLFGTFYILSVM